MNSLSPWITTILDNHCIFCRVVGYWNLEEPPSLKEEPNFIWRRAIAYWRKADARVELKPSSTSSTSSNLGVPDMLVGGRVMTHASLKYVNLKINTFNIIIFQYPCYKIINFMPWIVLWRLKKNSAKLKLCPKQWTHTSVSLYLLFSVVLMFPNLNMRFFHIFFHAHIFWFTWYCCL